MSLWYKIKASWKPTPINPPTVDVHLHQLDAITRSTESIRWGILTIEYWVSRGGQLREWLRHNIRAFAWLIIPEVLIAPVVTFILDQVLKWTTILSSITHHLILLPFLGLLVVVVLAVVLSIIRSILR